MLTHGMGSTPPPPHHHHQGDTIIGWMEIRSLDGWNDHWKDGDTIIGWKEIRSLDGLNDHWKDGDTIIVWMEIRSLEPHVAVVLNKYAVTPHPSSARPASGSSTEPAVTSPDGKGVVRALSVSSVPGVLLLNPIRRPSPVTAYCHTDVYSVSQRFDTVPVP